jgi:hypothetical protein
MSGISRAVLLPFVEIRLPGRYCLLWPATPLSKLWSNRRQARLWSAQQRQAAVEGCAAEPIAFLRDWIARELKMHGVVAHFFSDPPYVAKDAPTRRRVGRAQCDMPILCPTTGETRHSTPPAVVKAEGRKYFGQEGDQSRYYSVHG